jgi:hypothetical protein
MPPDTDFLEFPEWLRSMLGTDEARRTANHWVPLTYLKHFTGSEDSRGTFCLYDRGNPFNPRSDVSPRVVARENLLYVITSLPIPDVVERLLSLIESPYPELRRRLVGSYRLAGFYADLNSRDRQQLALFLAVQQGRTPLRRDTSNELFAIAGTIELMGRLRNVSRVQNDMEEAHGERPNAATIEQYRRQLEDGSLLLEPGDAQWIGSFLETAIEIARIIVGLPYRVVTAREEVRFPTSDHPVVLVRRNRGATEYQMSAGWLEETAEATITLDPRHVLVLGSLIDDCILDTAAWCRSVVKRTVENANRFVFADTQSEIISQILAESRPPQTVLEIDGIQYDLLGTDRTTILKAIEKSSSPIIRFGRSTG